MEEQQMPDVIHNKTRSVVTGFNFVDGISSKYMDLMRVCKNCVLGPRNKTLIVNGEKKIHILPAQCAYYRIDRMQCVYPSESQREKIKLFYQVFEKDEDAALQKCLIMQSIEDAEMARKAEILQKGHPAFYTKEFQEQALKYANELNKLRYGTEKHQHLHIAGDAAEKIVSEMLKFNEPLVVEEVKDEQKGNESGLEIDSKQDNIK